MPTTYTAGKSYPGTAQCLTLNAWEDGDTYVVRLCGELDLSGRADFEFALLKAEYSAAKRILIDLEALEFIDSSGLTSLLGAARRADADDLRLRITRGHGGVARMLDVTGLNQALPLS